LAHDGTETLASQLEGVKGLIVESIRSTFLDQIMDDVGFLVGGGKMLRARLILRVGAATDIANDELLASAAAVEMLHAASIIHDDVIDGGIIRRNAPTFWKAKGVTGAILLGDLLVCRALGLLQGKRQGELVDSLVELGTEMCDGEIQQELSEDNDDETWESCVKVARRKSGPPFAFVGAVCGKGDDALSASLTTAGYAAGTAYQLADDILDAYGDDGTSGKTLGSDASRGKKTAAAVWEKDGVDPLEYINGLCASHNDELEKWPEIKEAWGSFVDEDLLPAINKLTENFCVTV
jgi:geranylgeranyl pyrophosphate synthase